MAGKQFSITRDSIATGAAAQKVQIELKAPTNFNLKIYHWSVTAQGVVSNATPYLLEIRRATASITSTGTLTPMPLHVTDQSVNSSQAVAEYLGTGAYPHGGTAQDLLFQYRVPPTTGIDIWRPEGKEITVFQTQFIWFVTTAAADVNLTYNVEWEE